MSVDGRDAALGVGVADDAASQDVAGVAVLSAPEVADWSQVIRIAHDADSSPDNRITGTMRWAARRRDALDAKSLRDLVDKGDSRMLIGDDISEIADMTRLPINIAMSFPRRIVMLAGALTTVRNVAVLEYRQAVLAVADAGHHSWHQNDTWVDFAEENGALHVLVAVGTERAADDGDSHCHLVVSVGRAVVIAVLLRRQSRSHVLLVLSHVRVAGWRHELGTLILAIIIRDIWHVGRCLHAGSWWCCVTALISLIRGISWRRVGRRAGVVASITVAIVAACVDERTISALELGPAIRHCCRCQ